MYERGGCVCSFEEHGVWDRTQIQRMNWYAERQFLFMLSTCGIATRQRTNSSVEIKQSRRLILRGLVASLVLWSVRLSRLRSDVAGISGSGGRSGRMFRSEEGGEDELNPFRDSARSLVA